MNNKIRQFVSFDWANEKLDIMKLSGAERAAYDQYQERLRIEASEIEFSIKRAEKAEEALKEERREKEESLKREAEECRQKELRWCGGSTLGPCGPSGPQHSHTG
ncbi:MAG: hypothetical protein WC340_08270 [Kiritimatiellia bacterium]